MVDEAVRSEWPWTADPRTPAPTLSGDVGEAIAFGLARDFGGLQLLTSMLCSAIPDGFAFTAHWAMRSRVSFSVTIDLPEWKLQQTFIRTGGGLEVHFDLLVLDAGLRRRGFTKRLIRNLVYAFSELGVRYVRTYANHIDGAVAWAKLGAAPTNPEFERDRLLARLAHDHDGLGISAEFLTDICRVITETPDRLLFRTVVALVGDDDVPIGERLLRNHGWEAFWDLQDPALKSHLQKVVR